jgi:hypothetical protein
MDANLLPRGLPVGAEVTGSAGVRFCVWAPRADLVEVVVDGGPTVALGSEGRGHHGGLVQEASTGSRYRVRLDGGPLRPDPASRFQPESPHASSRVVDPTAYAWTDGGWRGVPLKRQVTFERSKLDLSKRERHAEAEQAFVLRYFDAAQDNLGHGLSMDSAPEPLLAPPMGARWVVRWSTEDPRYGGFGTPPAEGDQGWHLPAESAIVLRPAPDPETNG